MFRMSTKLFTSALILFVFSGCGVYLLKKPAQFNNKKIHVKIHYIERSLSRVMSGSAGDYQAAKGSDFIKVFATIKNISLFDASLKTADITIGDEKERVNPVLVFPFKSKDKLQSIDLPQNSSATVLIYFEYPIEQHPEYFFIEDVGNIKMEK